MNNMDIYDKVREAPETALKPIMAGRLKGKSDINPMWRIETLTELFGACGIGWYYTIDRQWTETGSNGEISAFCDISLYIKVNDEWSKPIQGTGGSALVAKEKSGLYTSDECYKMALTDAISVACKALGMAANVYWKEGKTKYTGDEQTTPPLKIKKATVDEINKLITQVGQEMGALLGYYRVTKIADMTEEQGQDCLKTLQKKAAKK